MKVGRVCVSGLVLGRPSRESRGRRRQRSRASAGTRWRRTTASCVVWRSVASWRSEASRRGKTRRSMLRRRSSSAHTGRLSKASGRGARGGGGGSSRRRRGSSGSRRGGSLEERLGDRLRIGDDVAFLCLCGQGSLGFVTVSFALAVLFKCVLNGDVLAEDILTVEVGNSGVAAFKVAKADEAETFAGSAFFSGDLGKRE